MAAANTGKLFIRSIPDGDEREQIIDFLCTFSKGATREAVAARLEVLPLTLGNAIPVDIGNKVQARLEELGAEVMFVYNPVERPTRQTALVAGVNNQPEMAPVQQPEKPAVRKIASPISPSPVSKADSIKRDVRVMLILLLVLVVILCGATAIFLPSLQAASNPDLLLNKLLKKNAEINNKKCPRNMNQHLRLDSFEAGNKKMTINYTLLNISSTDVNGNQMRPSVSRDIRKGVCTEANSAELLKEGVTFVFAVHGKDGGLIFDYQVQNEDCKS